MLRDPADLACICREKEFGSGVNRKIGAGADTEAPRRGRDQFANPKEKRHRGVQEVKVIPPAPYKASWTEVCREERVLRTKGVLGFAPQGLDAADLNQSGFRLLDATFFHSSVSLAMNQATISR
jgi:hypothetical protein